jgi:hypothetical protein
MAFWAPHGPELFSGRISLFRIKWLPLLANTAAVLLAGWTLLCIAAWMRRRLAVPVNRCLSCRYDLVGLPAGAPCPECGRAPPK